MMRACGLAILALMLAAACDSVAVLYTPLQADGGPDASGGLDAGVETDASADGALEGYLCAANADCAPEEVCVPAVGCATPTCGLPPVEGGTAELLKVCDAARPCADGLTCVRHQDRLPEGSEQYQEYSGLCFQACDPCSPQCPVAAMACLGRPQGGGFCAIDPLVAEGGDCRRAICAAPLTCKVTSCVRKCAGRDGQTPARSGTAVLSPDCPSAELCIGALSSIYGDIHVCHLGTFAAIGQKCLPPTIFCEHTVSCASPLGTYRVCSPDCSSEPCPQGTTCSTFPAIPPWLVERHVCLADGMLTLGDACISDRNCRDGLVCRLSDLDPTSDQPVCWLPE